MKRNYKNPRWREQVNRYGEARRRALVEMTVVLFPKLYADLLKKFKEEVYAERGPLPPK